ncbi:MAG: DNA-directed RNA polymerase subunit omega [Cyanophyceae cyanobacterium]
MTTNSSVDSNELVYRADKLLQAASNRYQIVVHVAHRSKFHRYEDGEYLTGKMKPVLRAVLEMSDELTELEVISDEIAFPVGEERAE